MGSSDWVAVPAGHADIDWDRLSSSYRLCLADARRSGQLSGVPSTIRISQATWARLAFILGFIYGVLDYDVFVYKRGDRLLATSPWDISQTIRETGAFRALCHPTRESGRYRCPTVLSLHHYVITLPCHAITRHMSDIVSRRIHAC